MESDEVLVGIFGRIVRWKGQLEFVQAVLKAVRVEPAIKAVIVGDESDSSRAYFDEVRNAIETSGLKHHFILAGFQQHVEQYYAAVDIVVHASIEPEPFGRVLVEGMAAGRAVIAADAGGPREVITHGVDGLLVQPGDVGGLANAIVKLAVDPDARSRLGSRGAATALRLAGIEAIAGRVMAESQRILGPSAADGR